MQIDTQTVLLIGGAICTALTGAVSLLWKAVTANHKETLRSKEECEEDRKLIRSDLHEVTGRVHNMEGRLEERNVIKEMLAQWKDSK